MAIILIQPDAFYNMRQSVLLMRLFSSFASKRGNICFVTKKDTIKQRLRNEIPHYTPKDSSIVSFLRESRTIGKMACQQRKDMVSMLVLQNRAVGSMDINRLGEWIAKNIKKEKSRKKLLYKEETHYLIRSPQGFPCGRVGIQKICKSNKIIESLNGFIQGCSMPFPALVLTGVGPFYI